ncbi:MAG: hypothetical protein JO228_03200 [Xanthobacteraceae bacterium]|nr:hypothetical protein [Xanthobacteraceae bacterium]
MPDSSKDKRGRPLSQLELDAQALHEKTARLREILLAHEAANGAAKPAPASRPSGLRKSPGTSKSGATKSGKSSPSKDRGSLADWLANQEDQGRRR